MRSGLGYSWLQPEPPPVPDSQSQACVFREQVTESPTKGMLSVAPGQHTPASVSRAQRALTQPPVVSEPTDLERETVAPKLALHALGQRWDGAWAWPSV